MYKFKYRTVSFGTRFELKPGFRKNGEDRTNLYENELATDVGGECLGWKECTRPILDHHFARQDQYPSAAAAVLHQAHRITAYFRSLQDRLGGQRRNLAGYPRKP